MLRKGSENQRKYRNGKTKKSLKLKYVVFSTSLYNQAYTICLFSETYMSGQ